jgi:hypothetical protein
MRKPRILKDKKGSILGDIGNFIQGITNTMPKPVLFLIFLSIMFLVAWVLSIIFLAFGTYCNSANQPVQLNANWLTNLDLAGQIPDPKTIGLNALPMEEGGISVITEQVSYCSTQIDKGYYVTEEGIQTNFTTPKWFYDGTFCTDCERVKVYDMGNNRVGGFVKTWCLGNVNRKEDKGILQRTLCGGTACEPPPHYYYSSTPNLYICADTTCKDITLGQMWDEKLSQKGATLIYPAPSNTRNPSSNNFIGITCTNLHPKLGIYGIDVFNFSMWCIIVLITLLLWAVTKFHN